MTSIFMHFYGQTYQSDEYDQKIRNYLICKWTHLDMFKRY